jgi:hypothetical protein
MNRKQREMSNAQIKPSVAAIKRMYADVNGKPRKPFAGWAGFKQKLIAIGVIENSDCDVPQEWQEAFKKACGR